MLLLLGGVLVLESSTLCGWNFSGFLYNKDNSYHYYFILIQVCSMSFQTCPINCWVNRYHLL